MRSNEEEITNNPQTCKVFGDRLFELNHCGIIWNQEITPKSDGQYHRRPDIYVLDRKNKMAVLIDMTMVVDRNIGSVFRKKRNVHGKIQERIRILENITVVKIIPFEITINGLVNKHSVKLLESIEIKMNWSILIKSLVIKNMNDIMNYVVITIKTIKVLS